MLQNRRYLGDDFYPAIVDIETFTKAEEERMCRARTMGRIREQSKTAPRKAETTFTLEKIAHKYDDPFMQAAYIYSLIESEVHDG